MIELTDQIVRFQKLAERTGRSKSSSYYVHFEFSPHFATDDKVTIVVGGYDIGGWERHKFFPSTGTNLLHDLTKIVDEAYNITKGDYWCENCKEYTSHDENGNCFGWYCEEEYFNKEANK